MTKEDSGEVPAPVRNAQVSRVETADICKPAERCRPNLYRRSLECTDGEEGGGRDAGERSTGKDDQNQNLLLLPLLLLHYTILI